MTDIEMCNVALALLGKPAIASFEETTPQAIAVKGLYAPLRDKVLGDRIWSFAKKQYILAPSAAAPLFGFTKKFELPAEVVRVHRVDDGTGSYRMPWDLQGRFILADAEAVYVTAVRREADTSLYSPGFCIALPLRLASVLCIPMTGNRQLKADLFAEYESEIRDASGADGAQGKSETIRSSHLADRRY